MYPLKKMIGNHPSDPHIFDKWLGCEDIESDDTEWCYRSLNSKLPNDNQDLVNWLGEKLVIHHYSEDSLDRLKRKFSDIGFTQYAEKFRRLPRVHTTKMGNATEIILLEYIEGCMDRSLIKTYKLRYNPNVDQSMKGDDVLLVDIINKEGGNPEVKIFLGEAKFREKSPMSALQGIASALSKDKLPISFSFLVERLYGSEETVTAEILEKYLLEDIKKRGDVSYIGFLLSNEKTHQAVTKHFESDNPNLMLISLGVEDPVSLINNGFTEAERLISKGGI